MDESLQDRLRDHAKAFDGLLSLIPADLYYGKDTDDQWQKKKQTKEEARAAKRAKLNPDNARSALDVMLDNERKRKREDLGESSEVDGGVSLELPKEGLKPPKKKAKKPKKEEASGDSRTQAEKNEAAGGDAIAHTTTKAEKRKAKKELKKAKSQSAANKKEQKADRPGKESALLEDFPGRATEPSGDHAINDMSIEVDPSFTADFSEQISAQNAPQSSASTSRVHSPIFDQATVESGTSSTSSIFLQPTAKSHSDKELPQEHTLKADPEELKARLQKRIEALRAARKADKEDGTPARNRQDLIEMRRQKEEQRKAHKKELRKKAKEEERKQRELALSTGSPLLSPSIMSPHGAHGSSLLSEPVNNFSFGRIMFDNGQSMTAGLDAVVDTRKKKGPQDPQTALQAAQNHASKVASLDPEKRMEIEEKDSWLNARKRAHGEKVRDDSSLLKKALKRKEKMKKKSEKEWGERLENVAKGQAAKQKKREENLQKRREEKGKKGKKGKKAKGVKSKPKARPGFEGSFRAGSRRQ